MKKSILFIGLFISLVASAQKGTIKGRLIDSVGKQQLLNATISVLNEKDSSMEAFGTSKADGNFSITGISQGEYIVQITFQGYQYIFKKAKISAADLVVDYGNVYMQPQYKELDGVKVIAAPVLIKKDTLEFSAGAFKTKPNANVEDMLKKLPGVEVNKDGTVKAQGEQVQKVLVDGKTFFGNDPKMATQNLPADMVDKVQFFDDMSEQSKFSGFDDGNRQKTMNITTKKDKRKGVFGNATIGAGDNDRFKAKLSANYFNGNQQLSLIGGGNNINEQNFSFQDIMGIMGGGGGGGFGGGRGVTTISIGGGGARPTGGGGGFLSSLLGGSNNGGIAKNWNIGLNFKDVLSKRIETNGSYFFNNTNIAKIQSAFRETKLRADTTLLSKSSDISDSKNQNHRVNWQFDWTLDSLGNNSLQLKPTFTYQVSDSRSQSINSANNNKGLSINNTDRTNVSNNDGYNFNNELLFRHRFAKRGRSVSVNLSQSINNSDNINTAYSINEFYQPNNRKDTIQQRSNQNTNGYTLGSNVSYTEPINREQGIELTYSYNYTKNKSDRYTYNYNKLSQQFDQIVDLLSNRFDNTNKISRAGATFRTQKQTYNWSVGMQFQNTTIEGLNISKGTGVSQSFENWLPNAQFQYSLNRSKNFRFNYRTRTNQPSVTQLQPVPDNSNPLNIRLGNPDLKQEYSHNINVNYNTFNIANFSNLFVGLSYSNTSNKIVNEINIDPNGRQTQRPINLEGVYSLSANGNFGFPLKKLVSNMNFNTGISFAKDASILNGQRNNIDNLSVTGGMTVTYNKGNFDANFSTSMAYNNAKYSLQSQQDGDFFNQTLGAEFTYTMFKSWILNSDFDYTYYSGRGAGFNQSVPLWTLSLSKQLFEDKRAEIKLTVFDVLNKNISINRVIDPTYTEDQEFNVLKRYFLLSFTYNLRKFGQGRGGSGMPPMPGGGGMPTIIRM